MAITSIGYDGTVDEVEFSKLMAYSASSEYGVNAPGSFKASSVAGQVRLVALAPGIAWTSGLVDEMTDSQTVSFDPVPSGERWDMIVLRRDWQPPGGNTTLEVIKGGATKVLPSRYNNRGVRDDQPLWMVRLTSTSSVPVEYVDLRVFARSGGATANDDLVRSYVNVTGTWIEINGKIWIYRVGSNGVNEWVELAKSFGLATTADLNFAIQDHGHRNLYDPVSKQQLFLDKDSIGPFLRSSSVFGREYAQKPNMYVTSLGTIGRSTVTMASTEDLAFAIQDHGHRLLYDSTTRASLILAGTQADPFLECDAVYKRTYAAAANVYVTSNGIIGRSTASSSLRRYKENIAPAAITSADVLALAPVTYDRRDGSAQGELGLIADDTAALVPQLALYEDGRLEGVRYDRLAVAQQIVLRDQAATIKTLTASAARAHERLDALGG